MLTTEQSRIKLFSRRGWHKDSGINKSTARIYKKRFLENTLDIETRMKILEACGFRLIRQMQWEEEIDCDKIKMNLIDKLNRVNVFWSYNQSSLLKIHDDILIEKVLLHLDINDVNILFSIFPKKKIRNIWENSLLGQEPLYHQLNRLYAFMYFNINNPDRYIHNFTTKKHKSIQCRD